MACAVVALTLVVGAACKHELPTMENGEGKTTGRAIYSTRTVNFTRPDGSYIGSAAVADFGNLDGGGWSSRAFLQDSTFKVLVVADQTTTAGVTQNVDISDGSEYELQYKVKFDPNFHFRSLGKFGFGFLIGDGNTGCDPGWDGKGGSLRNMWVTRGADTVLIPYIYHKDQPAECGNSFMARYPATGSISKGVWHTIKLYAKSNTGSNTDGHVKMEVNGTVVLDQAIRWTTFDTKKYINKMSIHTFRGGGDASSPSDGYIYYDDVTWTKLTP